MTATLETLRQQLTDLIEASAADLLEIQRQQSEQDARMAQQACDQAYRAGEQNGRTLERSYVLSRIDQVLSTFTPGSAAYLAAETIKNSIDSASYD